MNIFKLILLIVFMTILYITMYYIATMIKANIQPLSILWFVLGGLTNVYSKAIYTLCLSLYRLIKKRYTMVK